MLRANNLSEGMIIISRFCELVLQLQCKTDARVYSRVFGLWVHKNFAFMQCDFLGVPM